MNIHDIMLSNIGKVKKIFIGRKKVSNGLSMHPQRDWMIFMTGVFSLFVVINSMVFYEINREVAETPSSVTISAHDIDTQHIVEVATKYRAKEERFRAIVGAPETENNEQMREETLPDDVSTAEDTSVKPESSY